MQLKNYREVPPDGYRYTVPETGHYVQAWDIGTWLQQIKKHLESNNLPVPTDLLQQAEDQLCQTLPPGWCEYDDPNRPRVDLQFTWGDVETGSKTFLDWVTQGRPFVAQDEAERRAKICANCYVNTNASGCGQSCRELIRKLVGVFVNRKTSVDDQLKICGACRCYLRAKVQFPLNIIEQHDTEQLQAVLPNFCWLRKDSENYHP